MVQPISMRLAQVDCHVGLDGCNLQGFQRWQAWQLVQQVIDAVKMLPSILHVTPDQYNMTTSYACWTCMLEDNMSMCRTWGSTDTVALPYSLSHIHRKGAHILKRYGSVVQKRHVSKGELHILKAPELL